jgi:hypothetical protein
VRSGEVEVTAGSSVFALRQKHSAAITGVDSPTYIVADAPPADDWDKWCRARDQKENQIASAQYVPSTEMTGVEDLDQYGSWSNDPDYGPVWTPTEVVAGWAPYSSGCWTWVDPWGWTWIDDAPWGFAPFHYGRWAFRNNGWCWVPGAHIGHAVYAPALVTFVGGGGWHSGSFSGGSIGWFPLGPHEPYLAAYRANRTRMHNVDVEHMAYLNRTVPGAMTVVSNDTFVLGQPTGGDRLRLSDDELMKAPVHGAVAPLVPRQESFLGGSFASHGPVAQPPTSVVSRPVVARLTPPPRQVPFAVRQQAFAVHPGQPLDVGTLANLKQAAPATRSPVKVVTPGYPREGGGQPSFSPESQAGGSRPRQQPEEQPGSAMQQSMQPQPAARQQRPTMPQSGWPQIEREPRSSPVAPRSESPWVQRRD